MSPSPATAVAPAGDDVRRIADAVLYEGYLLWPYRKSALKNQQRFTFGGVYPPSWEQDASQVQTQVLLQGPPDAQIEVRVRCLQVLRRQVLRIDSPDASPQPVEELAAPTGERFVSWDEAVERELEPGAIEIAAGSELEVIAGGAIERSWEALAGEISVSRESLGCQLSRVTVLVANTTSWPGGSREHALRHTLCSAHIVLRAQGGAWVSLTDPPPELRAEAERCENVGLWPVLVGAPHERSTLLASPIILADHPEVAPESPGDLFDSGEIDQMLVLNILAMTDEERGAMRDTDPRAREILERTESLSDEQIARLNGAVRDFGRVRQR
ncbi:MAG: hypothetical protein QOI03_1243 [Solirubrobacteraceae bacterium]|jgi:hypothetical protein|nr:hypothetical protein [Solirubrobacteraceae bacterium]